MVWGLVDPDTFSDYFLNGEYTGWEKKLENIFENEMNKEQQKIFSGNSSSYISSVARKFTENVGKIEDYEIPTEYRLIEKCGSPASMIKMESRLLAVDSDLRSIIEEIEPGIHKFAPIKLLDRKGREFPNSYYVMIVKNFLDAFIQEQSEGYRGKENIAFYYAIDSTKKTYSKICISKEIASKHHIWRDAKLFFPSIFISDELQSRISKASLRIFKHHKMKEN